MEGNIDTAERLARIENLLQEGNRLRSQAMDLQKESLAMQKSLVDETCANIVKAGTVNDQALELQRWPGRRQNRSRRRLFSYFVPQLFAVF
ncbi:hypothetical protein LP415_11080 [Polaromonas sp. P1(28)-8]|nr:hypothetical protein LP415_11080 [Polaromonas sp. P1(28)-8]